MKRGLKELLCMSFTPCYSHLLLPFSRKSPFLPPGHCESLFYPEVLSSFAQKAPDCNNSLSRRISNETPPIVPLQLRQKLLQPLGKIMCVYWFDSQVMGVRSVHMAAPLLPADGCPRVLALKQRGFFSPFTGPVS